MQVFLPGNQDVDLSDAPQSDLVVSPTVPTCYALYSLGSASYVITSLTSLFAIQES